MKKIHIGFILLFVAISVNIFAQERIDVDLADHQHMAHLTQIILILYIKMIIGIIGLIMIQMKIDSII